jgi:hypothetical protein
MNQEKCGPAGGSQHPTGHLRNRHEHSTAGGPQLPLFPSSSKPRRPVFAKRGAPLAATADPASSALAAAHIDANGTRQSRKAAVLAFLRNQRAPMTSFELARAAGMDRYAVARALPDLRHDHMVERVEMRACRVTGRQSFTWAVTRA